jgi:hypothetical protein
MPQCKRLALWHVNSGDATCRLKSEVDPKLHPDVVETSAAPNPIPKTRSQCSKVHTRFIHIDKSGGSSVNIWMAKYFPEADNKYRLQYPGGMGHNFRLGDGCPEDCYTFFVRDPIQRWVSRYLMRIRMAEMPRYATDSPSNSWTRFLKLFPTPNSLGEALSSLVPETRNLAAQAWKSEVGPAKTLAGHFLQALYKDPTEYMSKIFFVGTTKTLTEDFHTVVEKLGMPAFRLKNETAAPEAQNAMPASQEDDKFMSKLATKNVFELLANDYKVLNMLYTEGLIKQPCNGPDDCDC